MLDKYYEYDNAADQSITKKHKRLLAVQAAFEIAKGAAVSVVALQGVAIEINNLANAIQKALEVESK